MRTASRSTTAGTGPPIAWAGLFHLVVLYLVWSSTYLAIRVAVRGGFPPFTMGSMRVLVSGGLLLLWGALSRNRIRLSAREAWVLAASGVLLWVAGNGLVNWAEQRANSGYAALLVASMPIWVAIIEAALDRRPPSLLAAFSLLTGFCGIGLLSAPALARANPGDALSVLALMLASVSWAVGSVYQRRRPTEVTSIVSSGYQQCFAGIGFAIVALVTREPWPHPSPAAWSAWGYLVVFGSLLAFTSYVLVLRLLPISIATTFAYVNPVLAVFLGWLVLHESVTAWTLGGAALVVLGVAGVFRDRSKRTHEARHTISPIGERA